jgi:hypothetical protein
MKKKRFLDISIYNKYLNMNKSQRIYFNSGSTGNENQDKYIVVKLEQNIETIEFLTMNISTEDAYQNFNSDYGVLVGRVVANGGVGIPNTKISVFIPLTDEDANDAEIYSVYPYKTPRDKNLNGKRYNLLPRVAKINNETGSYKPSQPFGSFPIKEEVLGNNLLINVYKKYYKYTALTNKFGDYMIFGLPIGTQLIHMSVDITDIGEYSMNPSSMIIAGYSENLFTDNNTSIKPSDDLNNLPNIETQEISVDIRPFWGDVDNFEIGITRQDFRTSKTVLTSNTIIIGNTMTMGSYGIYGNPDANDEDRGFYSLHTQSGGFGNNLDIRTYRVSNPEIRIFTFSNRIPIDINDQLIFPNDFDYDKDIYEVDKSEYFIVQKDGSFLINLQCNRRKSYINEEGEEIVVDDDYELGIFSRFYGMMLIKYPNLEELPINNSWDKKFNGPNLAHKARGWLKLPQSTGLRASDSTTNSDSYTDGLTFNEYNNKWRREYFAFTGGSVYAVAQFMPVKSTTNNNGIGKDNTENMFYDPMGTTGVFPNDISYYDTKFTAGLWFKTSGYDSITQSDSTDDLNYLVPTTSGSTYSNDVNDLFYRYDFPYNVKFIKNSSQENSIYSTTNKFRFNRYFGGQWLNFSLIFPQYVWAYDSGKDRNYSFADVYHWDTTNGSEHFVTQNNQKIFAYITNTRNLLRGDAFQTTFIQLPSNELNKLANIPYKGINAGLWNRKGDTRMFKEADSIKYTGDTRGDIFAKTGIDTSLNLSLYKYLKPRPLYGGIGSGSTTNGQEYTEYGWDEYASIYAVEDHASAYIFKGMYENDIIALVKEFRIV